MTRLVQGGCTRCRNVREFIVLLLLSHQRMLYTRMDNTTKMKSAVERNLGQRARTTATGHLSEPKLGLEAWAADVELFICPAIADSQRRRPLSSGSTTTTAQRMYLFCAQGPNPASVWPQEARLLFGNRLHRCLPVPSFKRSLRNSIVNRNIWTTPVNAIATERMLDNQLITGLKDPMTD